MKCYIDRCVVISLDTRGIAAIRTFHADPMRGESATAICELTGSAEAKPLVLNVLDSYAPGGFYDRIVQSRD